MDEPTLRNLNDLVALRLMPEVKHIRRMARATLVWGIFSTTVMISGWATVVAMLVLGGGND